MKKVLSRDYNDFFSGNFQIKNISNDFKHLEPDEKVLMLDNVMKALEVDLKKFSSPDRK